MPKRNKEDTPEQIDQDLANAVLGKLLGKNPEGVLGLLDGIPDPVVAAAVAIRVAYQCDAAQTAEFLAILEDETMEGEGEDGDGDQEEDDPEPAESE